MGIRFYCPNCDRRLHVKDFLAGKRGICPHCDESITIPKQSTITGDEGPDALSKGEGFADATDAAQAITEVPSSVPAKSNRGETESVRAPQLAAPQSATADDEHELDPITAGPHLIWYVRPPSGGQYGPAEGDVMRQWVSEGRVTSDSLVWQEGWDEWRPAAEIFPQLAPPPVDATPQPERDKAKRPAETGTTHGLGDDVKVDRSKVKMLEYRLNRSRGKGKEIVAVTVLTIVCVILVVVLGFIITKQF